MAAHCRSAALSSEVVGASRGAVCRSQSAKKAWDRSGSSSMAGRAARVRSVAGAMSAAAVLCRRAAAGVSAHPFLFVSWV